MADSGDPFVKGDSTDVRIRERLERSVLPADPAGAYERVVEKKAARRVRRRAGTVALAVIVVAGTVTGSLALIKAFGGPSVPPRPVGSSPASTVTAVTPSGSPSSSTVPNACLNSSASADFDANGSSDSVFVHPARCTPSAGVPALWSINFSWGPKHAHDTQALTACTTPFCGAAGSIPMNNGTTALILRVDRGPSSTSYVLLNLSPGRAASTYGATGVGGDGFPPGQPARFTDADGSTRIAFFGCRGGPFPGGGDMVTIVQTTATLSPDGRTYRVAQTELARGPNVGRSELIVVSDKTKFVAARGFDPKSIEIGVSCVAS